MRILVVDDEPVSRTLLERALKQMGHEVRACRGGGEAWAVLEREHYAVVVSDWMMPDVNGLDLTRRIRQQEERRKAEAQPRRYTYVVLLTALGGRESFLRGLEAGADDFMTKPFDAEQLRARLHVAERILGLTHEVSQLAGLLPICSYCEKIRDEKAASPGRDPQWVSIEEYVTERTEAVFSHGICPECRDAHYGPTWQRIRARAAKDRE